MEPASTDITPRFLQIGAEERKWERTGFEGVQICVMRLNEDGGGTVMLKAARGSGFPTHRHPGGEEMLVVTGRVVIDGRVLKAGDYLWTPPGSIHDMECEEDALLFVNMPLGTKIVD